MGLGGLDSWLVLVHACMGIYKSKLIMRGEVFLLKVLSYWVVVLYVVLVHTYIPRRGRINRGFSFFSGPIEVDLPYRSLARYDSR